MHPTGIHYQMPVIVLAKGSGIFDLSDIVVIRTGERGASM